MSAENCPINGKTCQLDFMCNGCPVANKAAKRLISNFDFPAASKKRKAGRVKNLKSNPSTHEVGRDIQYDVIGTHRLLYVGIVNKGQISTEKRPR